MKLIMYVDGGCINNHDKNKVNEAYGSFKVIEELEDEQKVLATCKLNFGEFTNNEAEYLAIYYGIMFIYSIISEKVCRNLDGPVTALIYTDSQLVVNQVWGDWEVKESRLEPFCQMVKEVVEISTVNDAVIINAKWVERAQIEKELGH